VEGAAVCPQINSFFFWRNEGKRETKEKEKRGKRERRKKRNEGKRETKEKENEGKRETKEKVHHSVFVMKQFTQQITPFHTNHNS
jgi:hypothetical protein